MFQIIIASRSVIFSKFFTVADREAVLAAIPAVAQRVVFVDTAATVELVSTVKKLITLGIEVVVRDHHDEPEPRNERGEQIQAAAAQLRELCGNNTRISNRSEHPACSLLIENGEFLADGTVIVADPDLDGLTGAMKALGVIYKNIDEDAEVFDTRPRQSAETLTTLGWLAVRSLGTLPPFNPKRPKVAADAKAELFERFVSASQGDETALRWFETRVSAYEAQVAEAERLAETAEEVTSGVMMVNTVRADRFDLTTLSRLMEARPGCRITVVRKQGFLSRDGGEMISLAVPRSLQKEIDLRDLVPEGMETGKDAGIISNTSFLLHVSEEVWREVVLPVLQG